MYSALATVISGGHRSPPSLDRTALATRSTDEENLDSQNPRNPFKSWKYRRDAESERALYTQPPRQSDWKLPAKSSGQEIPHSSSKTHLLEHLSRLLASLSAGHSCVRDEAAETPPSFSSFLPALSSIPLPPSLLLPFPLCTGMYWDII